MSAQTCLIFAGGPEQGRPCLPLPGDCFVIAADSGLRLCERLHFRPDLVLGDFDSLGYVPADCPVMQAPAEKDDTDTMLAVREALSRGYRDIRICGAFGGRTDHLFANLQTLAFLAENGAKGALIGSADFAYLQGAGSALYPKTAGFSFSVFAWDSICRGVTLRGVQYPLENAELTQHFPLGVSNVITAKAAEVTVREGRLLIIGSKL